MINDIMPAVGVWVNLFTATGITPGKRLMIQNKAAGKVLIWEGAAPPVAVDGDDRMGYQLGVNGDPGKTSLGALGVWALYYETGYSSLGRLCIQEYQP